MVVTNLLNIYGLFTLPDPDSDSYLDCKPNGYIVICRTFYTTWMWLELGLELESASLTRNKPWQINTFVLLNKSFHLLFYIMLLFEKLPLENVFLPSDRAWERSWSWVRIPAADRDGWQSYPALSTTSSLWSRGFPASCSCCCQGPTGKMFKIDYSFTSGFPFFRTTKIPGCPQVFQE